MERDRDSERKREINSLVSCWQRDKLARHIPSGSSRKIYTVWVHLKHDFLFV